ncbi:MAG: family 78 glycoside hydrolase catalytic domain [Clostridia bacterium]|nr:family 78 glycoside hydrolase catalytic domain [Clostridia bacterium]
MWITTNKQFSTSRLPVFYKTFKIEKNLVKCELNISALGIFNIKINGQEILDYFMPGWTNYNKYVHICNYNITSYLKQNNLIEITLADGWYSGKLGYTRKSKVYGEQNAIFANLNISFSDGSTKTIQTDNSWRVGLSQIVNSSFFDGERVDFNPIINDYNSLPFAIELKKKVEFKPYSYEPIKEISEIIPQIIYSDNSLIRLDFKQNFAGFITLKAQGQRNSEISIKHAEMLDENGNLYYDNLRQVKANDTLILSGEVNDFKPKFTFHGFRYAEISLPKGAKVWDIKGVVLSQNINYQGKFECSNPIINKIYQNVLWGQKSNFISIPTDCPQRDERLGWTGDAQVFCNSAMFNADCNNFFANYLQLIREDMLENGKTTSFVPFFVEPSVSTAGVPGWADAICVIPYNHYLHYKDTSIIEQNLPYAIKHLNYYLSKCTNYLIDIENPFGDWLSVKKADDVLVINQCFFALSALLVSKMHLILGDLKGEKEYFGIYQMAKNAFRANYLKNGKINGDSQTAYALSLYAGLVSSTEIATAFINSVKREGDKLTTGFIGVKHLLPALCEVGATDLAYKIIKQTEYPSWGYTIEQGATTIWERWNGYTKENGFETPSMNSFNHYSLGSCAEWLYSYVLGIKLKENEVLTISPAFSKQIDWARGEYQTINGKIAVEWQVQNGNYLVTINADENVKFLYNFNKQIIKLKQQNNSLTAVLKGE